MHLYMLMIVYMYADASILLCVDVGRCVGVGQRSILYVFFNCLQLIFGKRGFSLNVELTDSSRHAGP